MRVKRPRDTRAGWGVSRWQGSIGRWSPPPDDDAAPRPARAPNPGFPSPTPAHPSHTRAHEHRGIPLRTVSERLVARSRRRRRKEEGERRREKHNLRRGFNYPSFSCSLSFVAPQVDRAAPTAADQRPLAPKAASRSGAGPIIFLFHMLISKNWSFLLVNLK